MLENMIKVQDEYVQETRENLAIARVREKTGKCGNEEILRWAGEVSEAEKKLLSMKADYKNIKIMINKLLYKDQKEDFTLVPLTAGDPAFFTSDLHIIDHVRDPQKLGKFTDMLVNEVIYLAPETTKLKAAIAMKKQKCLITHKNLLCLMQCYHLNTELNLIEIFRMKERVTFKWHRLIYLPAV